MNRDELQKLAMLRLRDAHVLLQAGQYEGAYYLTGYVVECGLKACIAKQVKRYDFPDKKSVADSYTHDLNALVKLAGLSSLHKTESTSNNAFNVNWTIIKDWSEIKRYSLSISEVEATDLYSAVNARKNGILSWLRRHW